MTSKALTRSVWKHPDRTHAGRLAVDVSADAKARTNSQTAALIAFSDVATRFGFQRRANALRFGFPPVDMRSPATATLSVHPERLASPTCDLEGVGSVQHSHAKGADALNTTTQVVSIALGQGIDWAAIGEPALVQLGAAEAIVQGAQFLDCLNWTARPAPPLAITPVHSEDFSEGTLNELRQRLAVVAMIDLLVEHEVTDDSVVAALAFGSAFADLRPIPETIAYDDFVAWHALSGDLAAWFDLRFASSRVVAN